MNLPELAGCRNLGRDSDGVVEGATEPTDQTRGTDSLSTMDLQTERLVDVFTALAVVKEVLLDIITDGEQRAASCVGGCVHSVGTSDTPDDGT